MAIQGFTEGRVVHYVLPNGEHRPAIIVRAWNKEHSENGCANLQVLLDGTNDLYSNSNLLNREDVDRGVKWITSALMDEAKIPGTWHWVEPS